MTREDKIYLIYYYITTCTYCVSGNDCYIMVSACFTVVFAFILCWKRLLH